MGGPPTRRPAGRREPDLAQLPPFGRLRSYSIEGLFGRHNYRFDLDPHEPTLLTGVNGTGKSTILRTIDAISASQWPTLAEIPFERVVLSFEERDVVVDQQADGTEIRIQVGDLKPWTYVEDRRLHDLRSSIVNEFRRTTFADLDDEARGFVYRSLGEQLARLEAPGLSANEAWRIFGEERALAAPEWVSSIKERFPVLFVTDQRLVVDSPGRSGTRRGSEKVPTRVASEEAANQVWQQIQTAKSNYATVAQELDSDFPQRVVRAMSVGRTARPSLRSSLERLTKLRKGLEATGLLAAEEAAVSFAQLELEDPSIRAVIDTYVKDTSKKLSTLEPLARRLQLFTEFLNQHYVSKRVVIDQDKGFRIEVDSGSEGLPPARLSSGEQQILVLAHRILFRTRPGTLVLIDEPELSLHVVWQATFVDDLARMGEVDDLTFLLATHSPTLIHGREDLKRSLDL